VPAHFACLSCRRRKCAKLSDFCKKRFSKEVTFELSTLLRLLSHPSVADTRRKHSFSQSPESLNYTSSTTADSSSGRHVAPDTLDQTKHDCGNPLHWRVVCVNRFDLNGRLPFWAIILLQLNHLPSTTLIPRTRMLHSTGKLPRLPRSSECHIKGQG